MSIEADLAAFSAKLDTALAAFMQTRGLGAVKVAITNTLFSNVYSYDSPAQRPYERRYENGGLADPNNMVIVPEETMALPDGYQLTVTDIAPDEDGFPVAEIVESGHGYHWTESEMYQKEIPRPFYEDAEKEAARMVADEMRAWLREQGLSPT